MMVTAVPANASPQGQLHVGGKNDSRLSPVKKIAPAPAKGSAALPNAVCEFASDGDYVHASTYSGITYASGHGWWDNYNCPSSYRADVTIYLEENLGGSWYPQGNAGTANGVAPGSGSSQRATAKMQCVNSTPHYWRSSISATIVGEANSAPLATTKAQLLNCY